MRQHLSSAVWIIGGTALTALGTLVGVRVLTQFLTPTVYGVVSLALGMSALAISLVSTPLTQAAIHYYPSVTAQGSARDFSEDGAVVAGSSPGRWIRLCHLGRRVIVARGSPRIDAGL